MLLIGFRTFTQTGNVCFKINPRLSVSGRKQRKTRGYIKAVSECVGSAVQ